MFRECEKGRFQLKKTICGMKTDLIEDLSYTNQIWCLQGKF